MLFKRSTRSASLYLFGILGLCATLLSPSQAQDDAAQHSSGEKLPTPVTDFYHWVNDDWIAASPIPADKPGVSNFLQIQDRIDEQLLSLVNTLSRANKKSAAEQKISVIYAAYMDLVTRDELGLRPLAPELQQIEAAKSHADIARLFALMETKGLSPPLPLVVETDLKDSNRTSIFVAQSGLGLERDNYLGTDERSAKIRKDYQALLHKLFELAGVKDAAGQAARILALESQLARIQWSKADNRDIKKIYNPVDFDKLSEMASNLDISAQLEVLGMPQEQPFVIMQPSYAEAFNDLFTTIGIADWRSYLRARLLLTYASLLDKDFRQAKVNYDIARGLYEKERPLEQQAVSYLSDNLGQLLGRVYIENTFDETIKTTMEKVVLSIVDEYRVAISESDRMTEQTRKKALEKINKMKFKIGYPDKWQDYSALTPVPGELVGNHKRITQYEWNRSLAKLNKPVDRDEWGIPPQVVNAYYQATTNTFVLLAGILHPPFFDAKSSQAEIYGGIGFIIGHEIGHGFDDQGRNFDGDGNFNNWWSDEDTKAYNRLKNKLIEQANSYELMPGKFLNGPLQIGEIMGDKSGAEIALRALKKVVADEKDKAQIYKNFFKQLAKTWRRHLRSDIQLLLLDKDPHPPGEFRTNGIVKHFAEFHELYGAKPGDPMFMAEGDRVVLW